METAARMVTHDGSWLRSLMASVTDWTWKHKTRRTLIYIAVVVTLILMVEVWHVSLVGR